MILDSIFDADVDQSEVVDAVAADGYAIVRNVVDPETLATIDAELAPHFAAGHSGHESFTGSLTKRFGALVAKSDAVQELILDPTVLAVADHVLLPSCVTYRLHYTGVMQLLPGETNQVLHRDSSMYPFACPHPPLTVATMWAINDFTAENGGTRLVPGSHLWDSDRAPTADEVATTEMSAGSVLIYVGNLIHGGGRNRSDDVRTGVALHYSMGWLRQEENQYLAVSAERARRLPKRLQELLGYALGSTTFGFVDHIAPDDWLHGVRDPANSSLAPEGMSERIDGLQRFHISHTATGPTRYYPDPTTDDAR